jgi:choline dehydrogenase
METNRNIAANAEPGVQTEDFAERVRVNQAKLASELRPHYDFIVCGSGSSGSVVALRLAENPDVSVLLEAAGSDDVPSVMEAGQWPANLGSDRDWAFQAQPNPHLNGRSIPMNMGKVRGGGSSINVMVWARGHKNDWNYFASEGWNGRMMEGAGGCSLLDVRPRDGKRQSVFRSHTFPCMDRPNLTVLTHALVTRITFEGKRAKGVECIYNGKTRRISAGHEAVLSLGAIHTPKVLMPTGIGDEVELQRLGIPLVLHLPGVGQNFQDHPGIGCIWEYPKPLTPHNNAAEATLFWKSDPSLDSPNIQICQGEVPFASAEILKADHKL